MAVGDKIPLRFDYDSNNAPSALAEFTASDFIGATNGGTGSSSLASFLSGTNVSALQVSSTTILTSASSVTVSACPIPNPYAYAKLDDAGTAASDETNVGAGATITTNHSSSEDIYWNDSTDYFVVKKYGTYELVARLAISVASTTLVTLKIKRRTAAGYTTLNTFNSMVNSALDPHEATISAIVPLAPDDGVVVTHTDDGATNVNAGSGSTLTIKRLF